MLSINLVYKYLNFTFSYILYISDASLEWETLEQYFLWQLITAHNIPVEHIMPILPKLDFHSKIFILFLTKCIYIFDT